MRTATPQGEVRPILGFSRYLACEDGTIWSVKPSGMRQMAAWISRRGYWQVNLRDDSRTNRRIHCEVHTLVLVAFKGARPSGMECCHNDGDSTNNRIGNLRWDTHKENIRDAVRHGTHRCLTGNSGWSKLTAQQVADILRFRQNSSRRHLARMFDVSAETIRKIFKGTYRVIASTPTYATGGSTPARGAIHESATEAISVPSQGPSQPIPT